MSEKEPPSAQHQLAVTTNTIVDRFTGPEQDFDTIEKTAHLRDGLEIPLMVTGSIPDDLEKIYVERCGQSQETLKAIEILDTNPLDDPIVKREFKLVELTISGEEERLVQLRKIFNLRRRNLELRILTATKHLRYQEAITRMRSLDKHFLQLTVASGGGKRADHIIELGKAIQGHNAQQEQKSRIGELIDKVRGR